ncbi:uncharacterized protein LOC136074269 [Hydra vulgaris]|uniref:Uncharacterized protein LOC136074269 n=1 Tax=Hydra vulgaris TaxID=6087 RepID=A0ABM4B1I6_HYDVU
MTVTLVEIKKMIKNMLDEFEKKTEAMLKRQEVNFVNIINANLKITNERLDKVEKLYNDNTSILKLLSKDVEELKISLNFHEEIFENKIKTAITVVDKKKETNDKIKGKSEFVYVKNKLREIEDRARRNNLRIDGIEEAENETWEVSEAKVLNLFEEQLGLVNIKIERAHRTGNTVTKNPRTIVLKLLDFKDKIAILKKSSSLKGKNLYINEDFCAETNLIRKDLREKMKVERESGKFAYISYDKLIVRDWKEKESILCP